MSEKRLQAGNEYREKVIRHNMIELVDLLTSDHDRLPCAAAERISLQRLTAKEHGRTAEDIMIPMQTIGIDGSVQEAAALITEEKNSIVAVLSSEDKLAGVVNCMGYYDGSGKRPL